MRVARWIGRLGVVSLPTVAVGLQLEERVVRRHVAKLEHAGWLRRDSLIRGEGSILWLTRTGLVETGLGQLRAFKAPGPTTELVRHATRVGWTAARIERRGHPWRARRELARELERWEIHVSTERGGRLPDLAVWLDETRPPVAIVVERGFRRPEREQAILAGWAQAIAAGQYSAVRYDTFHELSARQLTHLAHLAGHTRATFTARLQATADEIAQIHTPPPSTEEEDDAPESQPPALDPTPPPAPEPPAAEPLPVMTEAQREQIYRQVMGIEEPKPRRRPWRR